jgi:hypothetical protein
MYCINEWSNDARAAPERGAVRAVVEVVGELLVQCKQLLPALCCAQLHIEHGCGLLLQAAHVQQQLLKLLQNKAEHCTMRQRT